ncbi:MAG: phosphotransferase family protein, partial [Myxococcales bacterium]
MPLPSSIDPLEFDGPFRSSPALWRDAVLAICARLGLPVEPLEPFRDGSNLVAAVGGRWVVKIFPPQHRHQWESERRTLAHFQQLASVPVPRLIHEAQLDDGWTCVVTSRVPGRTLESVWPACSRAEKARLLESIGMVMAEAHAIPVGGLRDLEPRWDAFLAAQLDGCRARHERLGMPRWFVDGVDAFVARSEAHLPTGFEPVLLTGEYTPFNLLVTGAPGALSLTAMIDFGDAMVGPREYDLLGPSLFLCEGDALLVRSLLRGYGLHDGLSPELRRRLLLLQVL